MPPLSDAIASSARTSPSLAGLPRLVPPHPALAEHELPLPAYLRSIRDNGLAGFPRRAFEETDHPPRPARPVELRAERSRGDPPFPGREPGQLRPSPADGADPAPDPRRRAADQRGLGLAPPAPDPGAGLHAPGSTGWCRTSPPPWTTAWSGSSPRRRRVRSTCSWPSTAGSGDRRPEHVLCRHGPVRPGAARLHRRVQHQDRPAASPRHRDPAGLAGAARLVPGALPATLDPVPRPDHRGPPAATREAGHSPATCSTCSATARNPDTGAPFSAAELRDQVATMILAGHETTAGTLFWAAYMLALAPELQERLAAEARAADLTDPTHCRATGGCRSSARRWTRRCVSTRRPS